MQQPTPDDLTATLDFLELLIKTVQEHALLFPMSSSEAGEAALDKLNAILFDSRLYDIHPIIGQAREKLEFILTKKDIRVVRATKRAFS